MKVIRQGGGECTWYPLLDEVHDVHGGEVYFRAVCGAGEITGHVPERNYSVYQLDVIQTAMLFAVKCALNSESEID